MVGWSVVTDGRGTIQSYEEEGEFRSERWAEPIPKAEGKAWVDVSRVTAARFEQYGGARTRTAFGFLHYIYNTNTVGLEQWVSQGMWTAFAAIDPLNTGDTVAGDVEWLTRGNAAGACLLLTADGVKGHIHPLANQMTMVEAAKQAGFRDNRRLGVAGWSEGDLVASQFTRVALRRDRR